MEEGDVILVSCQCCGRNFRPDVLAKHEPICIKSSKKQRKVFDSGKQRADGSDVPRNKTLKPGEIPKPDPKLAAAEARTKNWRQKHEQLVNSFKAARNYAKAKTTGGPLPPPPPPVVDSSLVQCPYCQRRFNEDACNRHVPFCKEQHAKLGPKSVAGKKPLYKAPPLKAKQPVAPVQKASPITANGYGSQTQSSTSTHSTSVRSAASSNLPVKSVKSSLPTRTVAGKPQASPSNANQSSTIPTGTNRPGSYNASAPKGAVKTTTVTPMTNKPGIRKPSGGAGVNSKPIGFCHECGSPFSVASARFCSECGARRLAV